MRWIPISLIVTVIPAILGWAASGWKGAAAAVGLVIALWIYAFAQSETIVARSLGARAWRAGARSGGTAGDKAGGRKRRNPNRSRILVYPEPAPAALVVRSMFSRGVIIVSQGMISCLTDEEFSALLRSARARLRSRGIVLASLSAVLLLWVSRFSPQGWLGVLVQDRPVVRGEGQSLTPLSAVHFVMLYPLTRLLLGAQKKASESALPQDAVRKIERMRGIWPAAGGRLPAALERASALSILS
jgi:hypothetical protein